MFVWCCPRGRKEQPQTQESALWTIDPTLVADQLPGSRHLGSLRTLGCTTLGTHLHDLERHTECLALPNGHHRNLHAGIRPIDIGLTCQAVPDSIN